MELRQLRYFVKAAESLSFSEAAKIANVAQSTLSQQIRQLEDELGVRLFERSTHAIRLTEAGREVLPAAQRTLHDADQCADRIRDLRNLHTGRLNIGVTYSFSPILAEVILSYIKVYPDIKLNVFYKPMAELMNLLDKREVDFVLAFKPSHPLPDVESHILFQNRLSAVVGLDHPLASRTGVTLADLERYDLALPARGLQARNAFDALAPDISRFRMRMEINEVNILLKIVRQSLLVTVLAEDSIYNALSDDVAASLPAVKAIPIDAPGNEMAGCVHVLKNTYHKHSMKEFIRLLSESIAVARRRNAWI